MVTRSGSRIATSPHIGEDGAARLQRGADVKRMRSAGRRGISAGTGCEGRHRALRSREDTHQGATPGFWPL